MGGGSVGGGSVGGGSVGGGIGVEVGCGAIVGGTGVLLGWGWVGRACVLVGRGVLVRTPTVPVGCGVFVRTTRVLVGRGVFVRTTRVLVGLGVFVWMARVLVGRKVRLSKGVLVGRGVTVRVWLGMSGGVGVRVRVALGMPVRNVPVAGTKGVRLGVVDEVGVRLAVGVMVRVFDAVGVGRVAVGKGPTSAWEVSAIAVLVLLALVCWPALSGGTLDIMALHTANRIRLKRIATKTCGKSAYSFQRKFITVILHVRPRAMRVTKTSYALESKTVMVWILPGSQQPGWRGSRSGTLGNNVRRMGIGGSGIFVATAVQVSLARA